MTNHYHLLAETVDGNLSRGMRPIAALKLVISAINKLNLMLSFE